MTTISPTAIISRGWELFKLRPWYFIGLTALLGLVSYLPGVVIESLYPQPAATATAAESLAYFGQVWPMLIAQWLISFYVGILTVEFAIRAHDNPQAPRLSSSFDFAVIIRFLIVQILCTLMVVGGFILLIIPGVILALALSMAPYLVVDGRMGVTAAISESFRITKGQRFNIFLTYLCFAVLNIVGALVIGVGLLVTVPVTLLSTAALYRVLSGSRA